MSMSHYFLGKLEDNRSQLVDLTRDKINEMIDAVALDHDTTRDINELFPLISKNMIPWDDVKMFPDSDRSFPGIVVIGDKNIAFLEFVPPPMSSVFFMYHPYQDGDRYVSITLDDLMDKIGKLIANYDSDIEEVKKKIAMEATEDRAKQRERITELMHHLAEARTLSMMGKLELKNWVMGALGNLNHYLKEELAEYNKRAHEE